MYLAFTEEQHQFRDAVREVLAAECTPARVRAGETAPAWAALAEIGVLGMSQPVSVGGMGCEPVDWVLIAEEAGYAAFPLPLIDTLAVNPLLGAGVLDGIATRVAAGEVQIAAVFESGVVTPADVVVSVSQDETVAFTDLTFGPRSGLGRTLATYAGARRTRLGGAPMLPLLSVLVGRAAELVGLARRQLDMATAYAKERRQFGRPIGSFQAVQHHLADALMAVTFAAPSVYRAACLITQDPASAKREVFAARSLAIEASRTVRRATLQVHGAIGYTDEYDLQLWSKRALGLEYAGGTAREMRAMLADDLLGGI